MALVKPLNMLIQNSSLLCTVVGTVCKPHFINPISVVKSGLLYLCLNREFYNIFAIFVLGEEKGFLCVCAENVIKQ